MELIVKFLVFMTVMLLIFWGLNIYKHIRGGWTKLQKNRRYYRFGNDNRIADHADRSAFEIG